MCRNRCEKTTASNSEKARLNQIRVGSGEPSFDHASGQWDFTVAATYDAMNAHRSQEIMAVKNANSDQCTMRPNGPS